MLRPELSKTRQERLLRLLEQSGIAAAVLTSARMVYRYSAALVDGNWPQAFVLHADGRSLLVTNNEPRQTAAERVHVYTGYTVARPFSRHSMHRELVAAVADFLGTGAAPIGIEPEAAPAGLIAAVGRPQFDLTPTLSELCRRKDADELASMREAIRITEAAYAAVKQRLEPGLTEYEAYSIVDAAMVKAAGTSVDVRGDFACGTRAINGGGPPTDRKVERGDLYIFDLFPVFRGYTCDLCRTFAVGEPSAEQQEAWQYVLDAHRIAKRLIRPGLRAGDVYREIRSYLDARPQTAGSFTHHAGHGVGMEGWEQPWLNAGSEQVFLEGEVIACEPGLYSQDLRGGIRLEHNYLVTAEGPEPLDTFPMDL